MLENSGGDKSGIMKEENLKNLDRGLDKRMTRNRNNPEVNHNSCK